ncbi:hypothetical protein EDB80DRAFT_691250 [Ilyonectria destructans]|nr:hypothetical protein EDB80DRAFT_691250 [Ilyonectria destructans]
MSGRRIAAEAWKQYGVNAYSYRFDTVPAGIGPETLGAARYQEVSFVFHNTRGEGYESGLFISKFNTISQAMICIFSKISSSMLPKGMELEVDDLRREAFQLISDTAGLTAR